MARTRSLGSERWNEDTRVALSLFAVFLTVYIAFSRGHFVSTDEVLVYQATQSLWEEGDLSIEAESSRESIPGRGGERYAVYNSGQSIAALPLYGIGKAVSAILDAAGKPELKGVFAGRDRSRPGVRWGGEVEIFFVGLLNAFLTAALCSTFFLLCRQLDVSLDVALAMTVVVGFGSYIGSFFSTFFQHSSEALFTLIAFTLLQRDSKSPDWRNLALAGLAVAIMLQFRFPAIFALPGLSMYVLIKSWRRSREEAGVGTRIWQTLVRAFPFAAIVLIGILLHFLDDYLKFGVLMNRGYAGQSFNTPLLHGMRGLLLSPGSSVFLYAPIIALVPLALYRFRRSFPDEALFIAAHAFFYLLVYSKFWAWHGMFCFGPRYLSAIIPLLLVPVALWLQGQREKVRLLAAALAVAGLVVQILHVFVNFWTVLLREGLVDYRPLYGFLFVPELSPLLLHIRALNAWDDTVDFWLVNVYRSYGAAMLLSVVVFLGLILVSRLIILRQDIRSARNPRKARTGKSLRWARRLAILALVIGPFTFFVSGPDPVQAAADRSSWTPEQLMEEGLNQLYHRNRPVEASSYFNEIISRDSSHLGGNFQLAKALEQAGQAQQAMEQWKVVLELALRYGDDVSAQTARQRIAALEAR